LANHTEPKVINIGKLASAHGIKGELKLISYTENPETIFTFPILFNKDRSLEFKPIKKGKVKNFFIVAIEKIVTRNEAELLQNMELYTEEQFLEELPTGEFYLKDLIGLELHDHKGQNLGEIVAINNYGAGDLIEYKVKNKTELLPVDFVAEVDFEKNFVRLKDFDYYE
jgi:16S rRNA processing protein RimM